MIGDIAEKVTDISPLLDLGDHLNVDPVYPVVKAVTADSNSATNCTAVGTAYLRQKGRAGPYTRRFRDVKRAA